MTTRRRSNRIVLQEVLEESRKEAEEALKSQQQPPNAPDSSDEDDAGGNAASGSRRGGSGRGSGDDNPTREKGKKRLRKVNDEPAAAKKKKNNVSKKCTNTRVGAAEAGDEDDNKDVVVLSDGVGDPDLDDSDDDGSISAGARPRITRKASGGSSKDVARNTHRRKRNSIHDDDEEDSQDGANGDNDESDADAEPADRKRSQPSTTVNSKSSTSVSIPKKAIPRRKPDSAMPSTSSLLAHMTPAAPSTGPKLPQGSSRQTSSYNKSKAPPPGATSSLPSTTTKPFQDSQRSTIPSTTASQPRLSPPRDAAIDLTAPEVTTATRSVPPRPPPPPTSTKVAAVLSKQQVMDDLGRLCDALADDSRLALAPLSSIDLSGSFLDDNDRYDFFDTNQFGEIVFQPKVPIFPEEFPPGMAQHTLSWWGVLDPALGDGKFTPPPVARAPVPGPYPPAPTHNGNAGPGYPGHPGLAYPQSSQLPSNPPPPARFGESPQRPASQQAPGIHPHGRGSSSWPPPRHGGGAAGRGGGGGGGRNYDRR